MSPIGISDLAGLSSGANIASTTLGGNFTLSPAVLAALATGINIGSAGGAATVGAAVGNATATSTAAVDLTILRALLPEAQHGHVITAEHHNALREAILWLASQSGVSLGKEQRFTSAPTFHRNGDRTEWRQVDGVASASPQTSTNGLLMVHLPDGAQIKSMTVTGRRVGAVDGLLVELKRQAIKGSAFPTIISIPLENAAENFEVTEVIDPTNVVPSAVAATKADYELVRNDLYKYFVIAEADNPTNLVEIRAIQIAYVA